MNRGHIVLYVVVSVVGASVCLDLIAFPYGVQILNSYKNLLKYFRVIEFSLN